MSLVNEQAAFLADVAKLINYALANGFLLTGGELYRTQEQQEIYVKSGRSQTMQSNHLRRLAIDFNVFIAGQLSYDKEKIAPLGHYWESLNAQNRWGGNFDRDWSKPDSFVDVPHFERNVKA